MDKIKKYKELIKGVIQDVAKKSDISKQGISTKIVIDDSHGQYLLYQDGWRNEMRFYGCFLHLEVAKNGKIWLQHDGTDLIIGQKLQNLGVPKSDIVVGFHAPFMRKDTEYALG